MPVGVVVRCGLPSLQKEMCRALEAEGFNETGQRVWRVVVDAPWGWAIAADASASLAGAVVITDNPCPEYRLDLLDQQPAALLSNVSIADIVAALVTLAEGQVIHPATTSPLTPGERAILALAARGLSNREIALARGSSEQRVKNALGEI